MKKQIFGNNFRTAILPKQIKRPRKFIVGSSKHKIVNSMMVDEMKYDESRNSRETFKSNYFTSFGADSDQVSQNF